MIKKILKFTAFILIILLIIFGISYCVSPIINLFDDVTTTDLLNNTYLAEDNSEMLIFESESTVYKIYIAESTSATLTFTLSNSVLYLEDDTTYIVNTDNLFNMNSNIYLNIVEYV